MSPAKSKPKRGIRTLPGPERTTGCTAIHDGPCKQCARERKRRQRTAERKANVKRSDTYDTLQRRIRASQEYVRTYLRRGAIVPADVCGRCECDLRPTPHRDARPYRMFHPDPEKPREVAWLCIPCYRYEYATREPLELTWRWPGTIVPRSQRRPDLASDIAVVTVSLEEKLPNAPPSMRNAAILGIIMDAYALADRERIFAEGSLAGRQWAPTGDRDLDIRFREWISEERAARGRAARAAGGTIVQPVDARPRKSRAIVTGPPPETVRVPFDAEAHQRRIADALEHLDSANRTADELNERMAQMFVRMRKPSTDE
jgi:hypothetical protein